MNDQELRIKCLEMASSCLAFKDDDNNDWVIYAKKAYDFIKEEEDERRQTEHKRCDPYKAKDWRNVF